MKQIVATVTALLLLSGCMGDGIVSVTGSLRSEAEVPLTACKLQLVIPSSELASLYIHEIDADG
ncbi:MAG: hypothetical protein ABIP16_02995, partial [Thermomonas sp.]